MTLALHLCLIFVIVQSTISTSSSIEDLSFSKDLGLGGLFKLPLTDTSDSTETMKSLKQYHQWLSRKERKFYVDKHRKEMSQEEKDQVKFYENLLQNIKELSKKMSRHKR